MRPKTFKKQKGRELGGKRTRFGEGWDREVVL
jgi:hypothetical protein